MRSFVDIGKIRNLEREVSELRVVVAVLSEMLPRGHSGDVRTSFSQAASRISLDQELTETAFRSFTGNSSKTEEAIAKMDCSAVNSGQTAANIFQALELFGGEGIISYNTRPTFADLVRDEPTHHGPFGLFRKARPSVGRLELFHSRHTWMLRVYGERNMAPMRRVAEQLSARFGVQVQLLPEVGERKEVLDWAGD